MGERERGGGLRSRPESFRLALPAPRCYLPGHADARLGGWRGGSLRMALRLPWAGKPIPWTGCFVALGLGLRLYHYARNPSMWHDEAALVLNVLDKGLGDVLGTWHL